MGEVIKEIINGQNVALVLFFIGVYGLASRRNVIKSVISLGIMQAAIILFFITINATTDQVAPIGRAFSSPPSDPLPHAMMITAVVVGISITAVSLTIFISVYHKYGSTNWNRIKKKREGIE